MTSRNKRFVPGATVNHPNTKHLSSPQFKPKPFEEYDIDIKIEACGVCGSDVHTITGGWGEPNLPLCVGHEIIGKAIKVGDKVTTVKVGDRVGVGAQIWACLDCKVCKSDNENYCPKQIGETVSSGGYCIPLIVGQIPTMLPIPMVRCLRVDTPAIFGHMNTLLFEFQTTFHRNWPPQW